MKTVGFKVQIASGICCLAIFLFHGLAFASSPHAMSPAPKAKPRLASFKRVLSYDELMRLPRRQRVIYLRGLRKMMTEIERLPARLRASTDVQSESSRIATLLSFFEGADVYAASAPIGVPSIDASGRSLTCGSADLKVSFATRDIPGLSRYHGTDTSMVVCARTQPTTADCGAGFVAVRQEADKTFWCATQASFNRLPPILKIKSRHSLGDCGFLDRATCHFNESGPSFEKLKADFRKGQNEQQLHIALNQTGVAGVGTTSPAARVGVATTSPSVATGAAAGAAPLNARNAEAARAGATDRAGQARPPAVAPRVSAPATGVAGERSRNGEASSSESSGVVVVQPVHSRDTSSGSQGGDSPEVVDSNKPSSSDKASSDGKDDPQLVNQCDSNTPKNCDASEIENARQKYAGERDQLACIYAGGISSYNDGIKRAYNCAAPHAFCFSSRNCSDGEGNRQTPDYACAASQVICNPLVFGLQADGKSPVCVEKSANATQACESEAPSVEEGKSPLDQDHAGLKEAWNEFADGLHTLCHANETAAKLHCAECDIIQRRLFALNVAVRDVHNCGDAVKYEASNCDSNGKCSVRPGGRSRSSNAEHRVADSPRAGSTDRSDSSSNSDAGDSGDDGSGDSDSGDPEVIDSGARDREGTQDSGSRRSSRGISSVDESSKFSDPSSAFNMRYSRPQ